MFLCIMYLFALLQSYHNMKQEAVAKLNLAYLGLTRRTDWKRGGAACILLSENKKLYMH